MPSSPSNTSSSSSSESDAGFDSFVNNPSPSKSSPRAQLLLATKAVSASSLPGDSGGGGSSTRSLGPGGSSRKLDPGLHLSQDEPIFHGADPSPSMTPSRGGRLAINPFDDSMRKPSPMANIDDTGADPTPSMGSTTPQGRVAISPFFDEADLRRGYIMAVTRTPAPTRQSSAVLPAHEGMSMVELQSAVSRAAAKASSSAASTPTAAAQRPAPQRRQPHHQPPPAEDSSTNTSSDEEASTSHQLHHASAAMALKSTNKRQQAPAAAAVQSKPPSATKRGPPPTAMIDLSAKRTPLPGMVDAPPKPNASLPPAPPPPPPLAQSQDVVLHDVLNDSVRQLLARARRAEKKLALALLAKALRRRQVLALQHAFRKWRALARPKLGMADQTDSAQRMAVDLLQRLTVLAQHE
jgi:hypothetical protein